MNEADWMPSPHVEREQASLLRRRRWEGPFSVWIAGVTSITAVGSGCATVDFFGRGQLVEAAFGATILLASIAATLGLAARDNDLHSRIKAHDRTKREEFGSGAGWIVNLLVRQGDAPTGADRGMLWLEGGRLLFSGDRTSFALSSDQIAGPCRVQKPVAGLRHAIQVPLTPRTMAGPLSLSLDAGADEDAVRRAVDRWAQEKTAGGQLPPTRIGPGAPSPRRLLRGALGSSAYGMASLAAVVFVFAHVPALGLAIALLALYLGWRLDSLVVPLRWRAFRDRSRLNGDPG